MLYYEKWDVVEVPVQRDHWRQVLLGAAELIEKRGWTTGKHHSEWGYCARGAILATYGSPYSKIRAMLKLRAYLGEARGLKSIPRWNDCSASRYSVLDTLRRVAER